MTDQPQDEWGPWIKHDGNGCPIDVMGQTAELWWRPEDGDDQNWRTAVLFIDDLNASCASWHAAKYEGRGFSMHWREFHSSMAYWVDHYRIRKPRGMAILESILADTPEQEQPT